MTHQQWNLKFQEEQYPGFLSLWLKKGISKELEQTKKGTGKLSNKNQILL